MVEIGQLINGKYRVVRLIGDGGMGSVYEAHHELLGSAVALKFLHTDLAEEFSLKERFLQEAHVSATIQNPHIVRVLDVDVTEGVPFLVMDLLQGQSLQRKLSTEGRFGVDQALGYVQQILTGLQAAHDRNIVHRDLKPDNVFITKGHNGEELLKILDFGIAKVKQAAGQKGNLTQPGAVMGTPEYMAPEQAYSADQVDARSDVYSVGVMLFEMLSGKRPAEGETPQDIAQQVLFGKALRLDQLVPELPAGLVRVVHTAIEPRPEDRWADARALRDALLPFVNTRYPASTYAGAGSVQGSVSTYVPVDKTPRIDGTRPKSKSRRPGTKVDRMASLEIPVEIDRGSQVPSTLPPTDGPPRVSALPSSSLDFAVAPTVRQTAEMEAVATKSPSATVNSEFSPSPRVTVTGQAPNLPRIAGHTMVGRRKKSSAGWVTATIVLVLLGAGGAGYYYYDQEYNSPVPPPRPVLRYPVAAVATPAQSVAQSSGPTIIEPLDPAALEETPVPQTPRPPSGGVASPKPNPTTPPVLFPTPGAASSADPAPAPSGGPLPPFTLPTSFPFPAGLPSITLPTALPQVVLPSGFSIPGLTPQTANSQ